MNFKLSRNLLFLACLLLTVLGGLQARVYSYERNLVLDPCDSKYQMVEIGEQEELPLCKTVQGNAFITLSASLWNLEVSLPDGKGNQVDAKPSNLHEYLHSNNGYVGISINFESLNKVVDVKKVDKFKDIDELIDLIESNQYVMMRYQSPYEKTLWGRLSYVKCDQKEDRNQEFYRVCKMGLEYYWGNKANLALSTFEKLNAEAYIFSKKDKDTPKMALF